MTKKCKITDEIIQTCADNIRLGFSYSACSRAINISYQSWCNWVNLGKAGKAPYSKWYIAIQSAESDLLKDCLESIKLSMKLGDVKSAYFLLQTRFADEGFSKKTQVDMRSQNLNLNVDTSPTAEEREKVRAGILEKLAPKNRMLSPGNEEY